MSFFPGTSSYIRCLAPATATLLALVVTSVPYLTCSPNKTGSATRGRFAEENVRATIPKLTVRAFRERESRACILKVPRARFDDYATPLSLFDVYEKHLLVDAALVNRVALRRSPVCARVQNNRSTGSRGLNLADNDALVRDTAKPDIGAPRSSARIHCSRDRRSRDDRFTGISYTSLRATSSLRSYRITARIWRTQSDYASKTERDCELENECRTSDRRRADIVAG